MPAIKKDRRTRAVRAAEAEAAKDRNLSRRLSPARLRAIGAIYQRRFKRDLNGRLAHLLLAYNRHPSVVGLSWEGEKLTGADCIGRLFMFAQAYRDALNLAVVETPEHD